jgi:hypothetical protein
MRGFQLVFDNQRPYDGENIWRLHLANRHLADCGKYIQLKAAEFLLMSNVADGVSV